MKHLDLEIKSFFEKYLLVLLKIDPGFYSTNCIFFGETLTIGQKSVKFVGVSRIILTNGKFIITYSRIFTLPEVLEEGYMELTLKHCHICKSITKIPGIFEMFTFEVG